MAGRFSRTIHSPSSLLSSFFGTSWIPRACSKVMEERQRVLPWRAVGEQMAGSHRGSGSCLISEWLLHIASIHCRSQRAPECFFFFQFKIRFYYVVLADLELKKCRSSQAPTCSNPPASAPECSWDDRYALSHPALPVISAARSGHLCISSYNTCGGRPIGILVVF